MKKKKGMIVMLCVLCVLLAVYFVLQNRNAREKEKEKAQEEADIIYVTDTDAANITSFSLNMGNGALSFEKRGGQWYYADDEDFPLDQSIPEQITEEISQITADRELEDGDGKRIETANHAMMACSITCGQDFPVGSVVRKPIDLQEDTV